MGCCLSKKNPQSSTSFSPTFNQNPIQNTTPKPKPISQIDQKGQKIAAFEQNHKEEQTQKVEQERENEEQNATVATKKKEVFVIQHRKSNDKRPGAPDFSDGSISNSSNSGDPYSEPGKRPDPNSGILATAASGQAVRTSSCTKEEVDAILIQCGRLSRSSSGKNNGKRYCGSKRSYDFERENDVGFEVNTNDGGDGDGEEDERLRRRQVARGTGHRRRSTPSRSRERGEKERSGSRERGERNGSGSRRVSRSPGRRSESPMSKNSGNGNNGNGNQDGNLRPGKLVSVPATVTSLSGNSGNGNGNGNGNDGNVKRVLVKRNVGSPRSQSPARADQRNGNGGNGNGNGNGSQLQQQGSLSRNGSRKAEHSPYRRTPLNEIDMNSLPFQPLANKRMPNRGKEVEEDVVVVVKQPLSQNKYSETSNAKTSNDKQCQGIHRRTRSRGAEGYEFAKTNYCRVSEPQIPSVEKMTEQSGEQMSPSGYDAVVTPVVFSGGETLKLPQTLMRSRSQRRSRDLDINVDALLAPNPTTSYNSLLLQDIQNFHQKKANSNTNTNANANINANANANANANSNANASASNNSTSTPYTLPPCITKACSILEAVADLNSSTGLADDRRGVSPRATAETINRSDTNFSYNHSRKRLEAKDPFVESEVKVGDDLMEPSLHKYVTVRKRGGEFDDEESSGSNSYTGAGNHQNWVSSSSWEPNSADSTDCWTSKSYTLEDGYSPVGFQRHAMSDFVGCGMDEGSDSRKYGKNGTEKFDHQQIGAARARLAAGRGPIQSSRATAASM